MKLYMSATSPYARIVRVAVAELGLADRVEEVPARTREADSPYYDINPSGRIPYLITDDGVGLEGSDLILDHLSALSGNPAFARAADWEGRALEEQARSLLDGLAVWVREMRRPEAERSPGILVHEARRARRLVAVWAGHREHPMMQGPLNRVQITLIAALEMDLRIDAFSWRGTHPRLAGWLERVTARPSLEATRPG